MATVISKAKEYAITNHGDQRYGDFPYQKHLLDVYNVLIRFNYVDMELLAAAWLHDLIEDTPVDHTHLSTIFSKKIADLVEAVSGGTGNRAQRNNKILNQLLDFHAAIPLKLADRIANMEWALLTNRKLLRMYLKEQPHFDEVLKPIIDYEMLNPIMHRDLRLLEMFDHIRYIYDLGMYAVNTLRK